jgi:hypothetical protein
LKPNKPQAAPVIDNYNFMPDVVAAYFSSSLNLKIETVNLIEIFRRSMHFMTRGGS